MPKLTSLTLGSYTFEEAYNLRFDSRIIPHFTNRPTSLNILIFPHSKF